MKTQGSKKSDVQSQPPVLSESDALQKLIAAHNAESQAILEFIRAHNRAAIEAHKARKAAK